MLAHHYPWQPSSYQPSRSLTDLQRPSRPLKRATTPSKLPCVLCERVEGNLEIAGQLSSH